MTKLLAITLILTILSLLPTCYSHPINETSHSSAVPYGMLITHCTVPNTIALTFDDGPSTFTPALLDLLSEYGARSTFFSAPILQRIYTEGHQIASHTFGHSFLPALDNPTIINEMNTLESLFRTFIGRVPTYMRPPFLAVDGRILALMTDLGYHVIGPSVDTKDFENNTPQLIGESVRKFVEGVQAGGTVVLAHDTHAQTVWTLTRVMLEESRRRGLIATTVADCLGEPMDFWYR
ncbi:glycoside hydrolase/deacetylase [Aspergillus welwitschiae]|uniref:Glycoside hydrolase/deacetylase n=1 Tax=Aspergillus welwitschiae TaxID=1341132 RepID=A0A3F3Q2I5_9EURO|nr:glycoside hydrolase/deacetylase [Aspergillus welwitschiae]RDH33434.1 glycoside hydrolase/deacetylase [Aspergillus welwitschiae]